MSLLENEHIFFLPRIETKKALLTEISKRIGKSLSLEGSAILDRLEKRENLESTAIGLGVAVPHLKINGLKETAGFLFKLQTPIHFEAHDDIPVDLLFVLLSPEGLGTSYLKTLAHVSRLLKDEQIGAKLRGCETPEAIYSLFDELERESNDFKRAG